MRTAEMGKSHNVERSRRINERKKYQEEIFFSTDSMIFHGRIENVSMGGAGVGSRSLSKIKKGAEVIIAIPFANRQGGIKRKAIVKWTRNDQFGVQFNRRENARLNYHKEVSFSVGSMVFSGNIKNISMGGAGVGRFNLSKTKLPVKIRVTIPFAKKQGGIKRKAIVRWTRNDQFGVQFI
ncbi:PilZ domain-containing protein [Desulfosarcina alkanivorans]|jgi:hypothetical protein|nr:PilZ domain-containing protein [Desulfosarcina alkanivorans]